MTIQLNDVYCTDSNTMQKCKTSQPSLVSASFSEVLAEFVPNVTDDEKGQYIVSDASISLFESDEIADDKSSEMYGYLPLTYVLSKVSSNQKMECALINANASGKLHYESAESLKNDSIAKPDQRSLLTALIGSDDRSNHSEGAKFRDLIAAEGKAPEEKGQSGKQEKYVSGVKSANAIIPESVPRFVSAEFVVAAQNNLDIESLDESLRLVSGEAIKHDSESHHVVRYQDAGTEKGLSGKATGLSMIYESVGILLPPEEKNSQETQGHSKKSSDEFAFGLKQANEIVPEKYQQGSGFENSNSNFSRKHDSQQELIEQPEFLFRSILSQTENPYKLVAHVSESIEKPMIKADILMQVAERLTVMTHDGRAEMEVQIHPENLGRVLLKIVNENGLYSAHITAENYQVKELIRSHLSELETILKEQGFDFFRLDVGFSDSQSNNRQWFVQDHFYFKGSGKLTAGTTEQFTEKVEKTYNRLKIMGHIDCLV